MSAALRFLCISLPSHEKTSYERELVFVAKMKSLEQNVGIN
jgi:hypothetical protein